MELHLDQEDLRSLKSGSALTGHCDEFGGLWVIVRGYRGKGMIAELGEERTSNEERVYNIEIPGNYKAYPLVYNENDIEFSAELV